MAGGAGIFFFALWVGACQQQMADQPRYEPLQKSEFFDDQRAARPLIVSIGDAPQFVGWFR